MSSIVRTGGSNIDRSADLRGLSTDIKPTAAHGDDVPHGSTWYNMDNNTKYMYNADTDTWYVVPVEGSGDMQRATYDPDSTVANAGGIVDYVDGIVDSKADENTISRVEDGATASALIEKGEQFYHNDILYEATVNIAQDSAIVTSGSGQNCTVSPKITEQIAQKADTSDLGTASTKNSTSVVTDSTDLVESGAVLDVVKGSVGFVTTGKNLLPVKVVPHNTNVTVISGVDNGVITLNGTQETERNQPLKQRVPSAEDEMLYLPKGKYIYSCEGLNSSLFVGTTYNGTYSELGTGTEVTFEITDNTQSDYKLSDGSVLIGLWFQVSGTYSNQKIYPMIRKYGTDGTWEPYHASVEETKADNSVIAPVENSSTASQAYAVGTHVIRNGQFITWKNAKAQGETINDASDYTSGDVASELNVEEITVTAETNVSISSSYNKIYKKGNVIASKIRFTIASAVTSNTVICRLSTVLPIVNYPMFDIRKQEAPYSIVGTAFFSPTGDLSIVHDTSNPLQAGTYEITFSFMCK